MHCARRLSLRCQLKGLDLTEVWCAYPTEQTCYVITAAAAKLGASSFRIAVLTVLHAVAAHVLGVQNVQNPDGHDVPTGKLRRHVQHPLLERHDCMAESEA